MSFLTAILGGVGGFEQGRQQGIQNNLLQQQITAQAQDEEMKRQLTQFQLESSQREQQAAENLKYPANWSSMDYPSQYQYLSKRLAAVAPYPDLVNATLTQMQLLPLAGQRFATTNLDLAKIPYVNAQTKAELDLPARMRQIAAGKDQTQLRIAGERMANSQYLAQYQGNLKVQLANLAGAYRMEGVDEQSAVRMAVADYQGQVSMYNNQNTNIARENAAMTSAAARLKSFWYPGASGVPGYDPSWYQPSMPGAMPEIPQYPMPYGTGTTPYGPLGGQGGVSYYTFPQAVQGQQPAAPAAQPAAPQYGPVAGMKPFYQVSPSQALNKAQNMLKAGHSPHDVRAELNGLVQSGSITPDVASSIETMLRIYEPGATPLAIQRASPQAAAGGAAVPFSL